MSNANGTCKYVLDPDDPETWGGEEGDGCYVDEEVLNEDGVWTCPHDAEDGKDLCIFHLPVAEKDEEETVDAFLDAINEAATSDDSSGRTLQFFGAKFGEFDLSENPPDITIEDRKLVMNHAEIAGALDWSGSMIGVSATHLNGIKCVDDAVFRGAEFGGDAIFKDVEFGGDTVFTWAEFGGIPSLRTQSSGEIPSSQTLSSRETPTS